MNPVDDTNLNVWFLNPPYFPKYSRPQRSPAVTKSGTIYFPIWLAQCSALLEEKGFTTHLTDAPANELNRDDVIDFGKTITPGLIVVDTSTPSIENDLQVCALLKDEFPDAFVVLVGTHVSAMAHDLMPQTSRMDAIARKEYDFTILELAETIRKNGGGPLNESDLAGIQGISFKKDTGEVVHNPDRPFIKDLDSLPWVSRAYKKHLNIHDYFNPNALFPMVTLMTSRGCPFRCEFCVYPQTFTGRKFRYRSIDHVIDEIKYVIAHFPDVKSIFFEDDTLTSNKKRCMEFAEKIIQEGIRISWTANSRIDPDFEALTKLKKAGCRSLCVGFESGDQEILDRMGKGTKVAQMQRFMTDAKRAGILVHGCFMFGFPGEDGESVEKTIRLAMELEPDTVQFYPVMVYPGTRAYEVYDQNRWITQNDYSEWLTKSGLHNCVIRNEYFDSNQLVQLCDDARKRFYLRPGYILKKLMQLVMVPGERKRILKAFKPFYKHLIKGSDI